MSEHRPPSDPQTGLSEKPDRKTLLDRVSEWVAARLTAESSGYVPYTPSSPDVLFEALKPGDVLLVEGNQKVSAAIKYLTQSTWSHAALYVGDMIPFDGADDDVATSERPRLVEVNLGEGCVAVPLKKYGSFNTRICRAAGLRDEERAAVCSFMLDRRGLAYDMRNIIDLARYLFPTPPVPTRWRRKMIAFGSGDPTRAICSTLLAQAFQAIGYPILPDVTRVECSAYSRREILHIRHHSLFTPRDFDLSPYFAVMKPTLERGFDHRSLEWAPHPDHGGLPGAAPASESPLAGRPAPAT
ncbi:MAG: lipo-like protein [Pseudomonadota bacterium]